MPKIKRSRCKSCGMLPRRGKGFWNGIHDFEVPASVRAQVNGGALSGVISRKQWKALMMA